MKCRKCSVVFAGFESCTWAVESLPARSAVWPLWFWHYGEKYAEPESTCRTPSSPKPPAALSVRTTNKQTWPARCRWFFSSLTDHRLSPPTLATDARRSRTRLRRRRLFWLYLCKFTDSEKSLQDFFFIQTRRGNRRPVSIWKFPFPKIRFFSGVLVERMILSTTVQFCKVLTRPTASAICRSASRWRDVNKRKKKKLSYFYGAKVCAPLAYRFPNIPSFLWKPCLISACLYFSDI